MLDHYTVINGFGISILLIMFQKIAKETGVNFENWTLEGGVPGACRVWINPTYLDGLDKSMTWEKLDTSWY